MKEKQRARHTDEKEKSAKHLHLIVIFAFTPQILIMCSGQHIHKTLNYCPFLKQKLVRETHIQAKIKMKYINFYNLDMIKLIQEVKLRD